jgi:hypothetical protein
MTSSQKEFATRTLMALMTALADREELVKLDDQIDAMVCALAEELGLASYPPG